ncbi:MAG: hypothetical protein MJ135_03490 [Oscillospiraceae bacterium]|nr:hypothetical protein [Oscillospiraceae bacterium]
MKNRKMILLAALFGLMLALLLALGIVLCAFPESAPETAVTAVPDALQTEKTEPTPVPEPEPEPTIEPVEEPVPDSEPLPEAPPIPDFEAPKLPIRLTLDGKPANRIMSDGSEHGSASLAAGSELNISSDAQIAWLYIIWDYIPSELILTGENGKSQREQGNYLHQLIRLEQPGKSISLLTPEQSMICEITAFGEGYLPGDVQQWQAMPGGQADLLLFPTHADDEWIFFGGILPYYAGHMGYRVQVCYVISHTESQNVRNHELLNALWHAGVTYYPVIHTAPDLYSKSLGTAEQQYGEMAFEEYQVEQIRRFQPLVVIGQAVDGEYGHGAHRLNTACLMRAVWDAADESCFAASAEKYGAWDAPKTYLHNYGDHPLILSGMDEPLAFFGGKTAMQVCYESYLFNQSQEKKDSSWVFSAKYNPYCFGLYRSTVGEDTDFSGLFEHIAWENFGRNEPASPNNA